MEKQKKFQLKNILVISFAHFVHDTYSAFLAPIVPLLKAKLGINNTLVSLMFVAQQIPALLNPFIGIIADNLKIRYLVILAPAVTTICMSLLGVAPLYIIIIILLFVMGLSSALFHVPTPVLIKKISGDRIGKGMSFYMLGGEAARTVGPLIIVAAVDVWGLEGTFRLIPFGLLASLILYFRLKNINISKDIKNDKSLKGIKETFIEHLPFFILITGIMFFRGFMKTSISSFLPTYLEENGGSLWLGGVSLSVFEFAGAIGAYLAGTFSDKIGRIRMLTIIILVSPILMFLFTYTEGVMMFPLLLLLGFFLISSTPVLLALVMDIDSEHQAFLSGVFMFISFISSSFTALFIGILSDYIGLVATYKVASVLAFFAIPFVLILRKKFDSK
ncbi:MAG: MFS transporter [Bacteroidales bacterium]|jgi:FSR family fosmidomycin resistance protein-like MFS transporter|nr:MFS transporter [Bacteroidales bacterium]